MASIEFFKKIISSILQPLLCTLSFCISFNSGLANSLFSLFLASSLGYIFAGFLFVYVEETGIKRIKIPPLMIFKSFLMDWLDRKNEHIENYLERLSVIHPIKVSTISFKSKNSGKIKGIIVVSNFHPGPFLNVGSSTLPYLIQRIIEKKYETIVAVPHGISGHELNLPSQKQNEIIIKKVLELINRSSFGNKNSKFIRAQSGKAQASCQLLNNNALITITLSPFDMEDISPNICSFISEGLKRNFNELIIIDAHNSLENLSFIDEEKTMDIVNSVNASMEIALNEKPCSIELGVAKLNLEDFSLSQGIGPGGLRVFLIKAYDQLSSYIVVDGNNMKAGLREKILKAIKELGVEDGEIMTTDTHMVNGLISSKFGYYPVGYAIDQKKFLEAILEGVKIAKRNLEEVEVSCASEEIKVKTLGLKTVESLSEFVKKVARFTLIFTAITIVFSISMFLIITYL
jgi:putative membrane protein